MSANQPTSFRLPFSVEGLEPKVQNAIRYAFSSSKDLNDAIIALNTKVETNKASIAAINETLNVTATASTTPTPTTETIGAVNLQPNLTPGAYTLAQTDLGGLIFVNSAIAFALTLNSGLMLPFFTTVYNFGAGVITATPSLGLVNSVASLTVTQGEMAIVFFDGTGWEAVYPQMPQSSPAVVSNWINSYNAITGVFTRQQPRAADLVDSTTGAGPVVLDSGGTLINTTLTGITRLLNIGIFANNAAAIAGGLVVGDLYRSGANPDGIFIVH